MGRPRRYRCAGDCSLVIVDHNNAATQRTLSSDIIAIAAVEQFCGTNVGIGSPLPLPSTGCSVCAGIVEGVTHAHLGHVILATTKVQGIFPHFLEVPIRTHILSHFFDGTLFPLHSKRHIKQNNYHYHEVQRRRSLFPRKCLCFCNAQGKFAAAKPSTLHARHLGSRQGCHGRIGNVWQDQSRSTNSMDGCRRAGCCEQVR